MLLVTSDNEQLEVSWPIFRRIGIFSPPDEASYATDEPIPLPNVSSSVLKKLLEYLEYHKDDPLPAAEGGESEDPRRRRVQEISEWDRRYIQVDQEMLFEIILAANYLEIKPLLDLGCTTVAEMIKSKTPEEIRKLFNIVNQFTPEEEAAIKKENEWSEDR